MMRHLVGGAMITAETQKRKQATIESHPPSWSVREDIEGGTVNGDTDKEH